MIRATLSTIKTLAIICLLGYGFSANAASPSAARISKERNARAAKAKAMKKRNQSARKPAKTLKVTTKMTTGLLTNDAAGHTLKSALPISKNTVVQGSIDFAGDIDMYMFSQSNNGAIGVQIDSNENIDCQLLTINGDAISTTTDLDETGSCNFIKKTGPGLYYLAVFHNNAGETADYLLEVQHTENPADFDDFGNTVDSAAPLTLDNQIRGAIELPGDLDVFTITVPKSGKLSVSTFGRTNTFLAIHTLGGKALAWDSNSGKAQNAHLVLNIPAGTYVVSVQHNNNKGTGSYDLYAELK